MDSFMYRQPTPNERLYLNEVFRYFDWNSRFSYLLFKVFTVIFGIATVLTVFYDVLIGIVLLLATGLFLLLARLINYKVGKCKADDNGRIFTIKGHFHTR